MPTSSAVYFTSPFAFAAAAFAFARASAVADAVTCSLKSGCTRGFLAAGACSCSAAASSRDAASDERMWKPRRLMGTSLPPCVKAGCRPHAHARVQRAAPSAAASART